MLKRHTHINREHITQYFIGLLATISLVACGGGGGGGGGGGTETPPANTPPTTEESKQVIFELIDPSPTAGNQFGHNALILDNGNIVVASPDDSSQVEQGGAVHLYNGDTKELISSLYGDTPSDQLGSGGLVELGGDNNRFMVISPNDESTDSPDNTGIVRIIDGDTGGLIARIEGEFSDDRIGSGGAFVLNNGNFIINSPNKDGGVLAGPPTPNLGSVALYSGASAKQIGNAVEGEHTGDSMGEGGVTALNNNNYIISTPSDRVSLSGTLTNNVGSITLVNGNTGSVITKIEGDNSGDIFGLNVTALENDNFVVYSPDDNIDGDSNRGSARLINGVTGAQIGLTIEGQNPEDRLSSGKVHALPGSMFLVSSPRYQIAGVDDAGVVRLYSGVTGSPLGVLASGDNTGDRMGEIVTVLPHGFVVIGSHFDDINGISDAGSVQLFDVTGTPRGNLITGTIADDNLGLGGVFALSNGNYIINSFLSGDNDTGSIHLVNGINGSIISHTQGDSDFDGADATAETLNAVSTLPNGNYILSSPGDDPNGMLDAGTATLFDGLTGQIIGTPIIGDTGDKLGNAQPFQTQGAFTLSNNHALIITSLDDTSGISNSGSVIFMNGTTAAIAASSLLGETEGDMESRNVFSSITGHAVIGLPKADNGALEDAGKAYLYTP